MEGLGGRQSRLDCRQLAQEGIRADAEGIQRGLGVAIGRLLRVDDCTKDGLSSVENDGECLDIGRRMGRWPTSIRDNCCVARTICARSVPWWDRIRRGHLLQ